MASRMEDFWNREPPPEPVLVDPNLAAAEALTAWMNDRVQKLQRLANPSRERCQALMLLLQFRYFHEYHRASPEQRGPLHDAYAAFFDRLWTMWVDTDPLLPELSRTGSVDGDAGGEAGVFLMEARR